MPGMPLDWPSLSAFADEVIHALGGGRAVPITDAQGEQTAVAVATQREPARHLLLIRPYGRSLAISLPVDDAWLIHSRQEWAQLRDVIVAAVAAHRTQYPDEVTMSDVAIALLPQLHAATGRKWWCDGFPAVPVPSETWLRGGHAGQKGGEAARVGLFQARAAVRVVVEAGASMHARLVTSPANLAALAAWVLTGLTEQARAREQAASERAAREALPRPQLKDVLQRLRSGERIRAGGGRYSRTFFVRGGALLCEVFDEGMSYEETATEDDLMKSIELHPEAFRL